MRSCSISIVLLGMALAPLAPLSAQPAPPASAAHAGVGEAPPIIIRQQKDGANTITERVVRGRVTEIRVDRGANAYFLEPNNPPGSALPGDAEAPVIRAPQWRLFEFDMKRPGQERQTNRGGDGLPPPGQ